MIKDKEPRPHYLFREVGFYPEQIQLAKLDILTLEREIHALVDNASPLGVGSPEWKKATGAPLDELHQRKRKLEIRVERMESEMKILMREPAPAPAP